MGVENLEKSSEDYVDPHGEVFKVGDKVVVTGGPENKLRHGPIEEIAVNESGQKAITVRTAGGEMFTFTAGSYDLNKEKNW